MGVQLKLDPNSKNWLRQPDQQPIQDSICTLPGPGSLLKKKIRKTEFRIDNGLLGNTSPIINVESKIPFHRRANSTPEESRKRVSFSLTSNDGAKSDRSSQKSSNSRKSIRSQSRSRSSSVGSDSQASIQSGTNSEVVSDDEEDGNFASIPELHEDNEYHSNLATSSNPFSDGSSSKSASLTASSAAASPTVSFSPASTSENLTPTSSKSLASNTSLVQSFNSASRSSSISGNQYTYNLLGKSTDESPKITISAGTSMSHFPSASSKLIQMRRHAHMNSEKCDPELLSHNEYFPMMKRGFISRFLCLFVSRDANVYIGPLESSHAKPYRPFGSFVSRFTNRVASDLESQIPDALEAVLTQNNDYDFNSFLHNMGYSRCYVDENYHITIHVSSYERRVEFMLAVCEAMMLYGSPSHKIQQSLRIASRILQLPATFLYLPDCMFVYFKKLEQYSPDVFVVRVTSQTDLNRMVLVNEIFRRVMRDKLSAEDGTEVLRNITSFRPLYRDWLVAFMHGVASASILPVVYGGGWRDMLIGFVLGLLLGIFRVYINPRFFLFDSLFEVIISIILSFLGRAFGSISRYDKPVFCFAALVEGAITLILPGYVVFCGVLELQSKNIVAGGVRMLYAVIFSLFLSFGITIGSALYGWMDKDATDADTCMSIIAVSPYWYILLIPIFTLSLLIVTQSHPRQWPIQMFVACCGYVVYYFSSLHFGASQISSAIGSFAVGCLGNMYSHFIKSSSFAVVLPAIFVLVPSGFAAQGGVSAGLDTASQITSKNTTTNTTTVTTENSQNSSLEFGFTMVEIAIGIAIGFLASSLTVYPFFGYRRKNMML
ncbi:ThrE domain-containing protein [Schizosaccharomyces pombe]|uniref:Uncharacterized protein C16A10.01 n=1 Tax=Schizosaccharomyces pombe (strain 972 / ATCC 24843) TaxID=284812 RepID=YDN1_SCHPO|nr:uncharacterized protein SPAC16A10.01 [Schizosaccharomyces pombe]P87293.1 RecName: Full=Uncharacterized protein C16A10.01 [Schizosaccharomyces pombe 972h-]CAB10002.1 DUF1212 family protein [Schizosaccharomyces pombe]|eukprot:NP_594041.1 uncharacterized protein SPAC16A10.01 [Schizosaccharomyces pombe]